MKLRSRIIAVVIGLSLFSMACSKAARMSDDEKHKLFYAVAVTQDMNLILEATQKMGLMDSGGSSTPALEPFMKEHLEWTSKNQSFIKEHTSREKAEAYVKSHMP